MDSLPGTLSDRQRLSELRADLADLPERQRAALVLRELSGLGHEDIAQVLSILGVRGQAVDLRGAHGAGRMRGRP